MCKCAEYGEGVCKWEAHVWGCVCKCGKGERVWWVWQSIAKTHFVFSTESNWVSHTPHMHTLTHSPFPHSHKLILLTLSHTHIPITPHSPHFPHSPHSCTPPPPSHPTQVLATGLSALYSELPTSRDISVEEWQSPLPVIETAVPELRRFTQALTFCNSVLQVRPTFTHLETYLLGPHSDQGSSWDNLSLLHTCLTEPGF